MIVTLYTSRVVLNVLGIEEYGIYNVVGGIVVLFTFLNSAMASATQRFLAFDIGAENHNSLVRTFISVLIIHIVIGLVIILLCETVGIWYLQEKLQFPREKISSVKFIFQLSILSVFISVVQVPFHSLIIAYERMKVYAYLGIFEVVLKLLIVYLLTYFSMDKLKLYSLLTTLSTAVVFLVYAIYCRVQFAAVFSFRRLSLDFKKFKILLSYSGWNLFGNLAAMSRVQGHNLLLNDFYGPKVNAAYSVTLQVQNALNLFVNNIQLAISPQIIKKYAQNDISNVLKLIFQGARYCFFMMFLLLVPIYVNMEYILKKWLVLVPEYTVNFSRLCLIIILIDSLSGPIMTGIQATGKIKKYQMLVGLLLFFNLPLSYFLLLIFKEPIVVFCTSITISVLALFFRLYFLKSTLNVSIFSFCKDLFIRIFLTILLTLAAGYFLNTFFAEKSGLRVLYTICLIFCMIVNVLIFAMKKEEKNTIMKKINKVRYE